MKEHKKILLKKAAYFEAQALATKDKFNKGYFEGKSEAFRLAHDSLHYTESMDIKDCLNGDL